MNKLTKQRREVKSPFTKEERQGVFVYQSIKALVFAPLCYGVYYYAKEGHSEFRQRYHEMLTWRK